MSDVDLTQIPLEQLLQELARRAGGSYQPAEAKAGMRHETKEAWAAAQAEKWLRKHNAELDPSVRARLLGEVEKFKRLEARYKLQRV